LVSAFALFVAPVDVSILLSPGFDIVLNPVPDVPADPETPDEPEVPEEPLSPDVPDEPFEPVAPIEPVAPVMFLVIKSQFDVSESGGVDDEPDVLLVYMYEFPLYDTMS
jgi:hypothetical protein